MSDTPTSMDHALRILASMPPAVALAAEGSEDPDGDAALDWFGPGRQVSASINSAGDIAYAWAVGGGRQGGHGVIRAGQSLEPLLERIRAVTGLDC